jgi:hypothetical protein
MALSEWSGQSAVMDGARPESGWGQPIRLARLWPQDEPAASGGPGWFIEDPGMQALESPRLTLVWPTEPAIDHPETTLSIREVLTAWRAADRELGEVSQGSPEWPAIHANLVSLRATYHRLFDECRDRGRLENEARMTELGRYITGVGRPRSNQTG